MKYKSQINEKKVVLTLSHALLHVIFLHEEKNSILQKYNQNKHLFISAFLFLLFYFHSIHIFCFCENRNADNICSHFMFQAIQSGQCYKQTFWLFNNFLKHWLDKIPPSLCWFSQRIQKTDDCERDIPVLFLLVNIFQTN